MCDLHQTDSSWPFPNIRYLDYGTKHHHLFEHNKRLWKYCIADGRKRSVHMTVNFIKKLKLISYGQADCKNLTVRSTGVKMCQKKDKQITKFLRLVRGVGVTDPGQPDLKKYVLVLYDFSKLGNKNT